MATKQDVLTTVEDLVSSFLYYDRKEDEDLPRGEVERLVESGAVSVDEIVAKFREELEKVL